MEKKKIKTYGELKEHLLAVMDYASDEKNCKGNRGISKGKYWNMLISCCMEQNDNNRCNDIIIKNTLKEFPEYLRCDYQTINQ